MPNTHETLSSLFMDIAKAIRDKTKEEALITADNFPSAIAAIPTGGEFSTLTDIPSTGGSKSTGSESRFSATATISPTAGASLYCVFYTDHYTSYSTATTAYILFDSQGSMLFRSSGSITVSVIDGNYVVAYIHNNAGTGTTYAYRFRGFALS